MSHQLQPQPQSQPQQPVIIKNPPIAKPNSIGISGYGDDKQIKAIEELHNFKAKKSVEQTVKDMEDLTVRDTMRDKKLIDSLSPNKSNSFLNDADLYSASLVNSKNEPYKALLKEVNIFLEVIIIAGLKIRLEIIYFFYLLSFRIYIMRKYFIYLYFIA